MLLYIIRVGSVVQLWEEFMAPALRGTENQSIKFAWAEGLVQACSVPLSPEDLVKLSGNVAGREQQLEVGPSSAITH